MERRTVIITGAGIGIGAATARAFAVADYRVVVTDVLEDDGQAVADEIRAAGGEAEFRHLDVTSTDEVDGVVAAVEKAHGPLEALVANAGILRREPLTALDDARWDLTLDVDLKGVMSS